MGDLLESDTAFYAAVGGVTIAIFAVGVAVFVIAGPITGSIAGWELAGLLVGFGLFMLVFFISIAVQRLEDGEL